MWIYILNLTYQYVFRFHFNLYFHVWIQIRIQQAPEYGSNTDPDPKHWLDLTKRVQYQQEYLLFYLGWSRELDLHTGSDQNMLAPAPQHCLELCLTWAASGKPSSCYSALHIASCQSSWRSSRKEGTTKFSVAEPKLFIFGSGSIFVHNFGSSSSYSHILLLRTVLKK